MKTEKLYTILVLLLICMASGIQYNCSSTSTSATMSTPPQPDIPYTSLLDRLRKVPGLTISGTEYNPTIRIRGNRSIEGNNEPLFEVDGTIVGNGYDSVRAIDVNQVESIRVLPAAQAGRYGSRGGNGSDPDQDQKLINVEHRTSNAQPT